MCAVVNVLILNIFTDEQPAEKIPQSHSHVFNAGGPVWGLDWCPIHPDDREGRYFLFPLHRSVLFMTSLRRYFVSPVHGSWITSAYVHAKGWQQGILAIP